MIRNDLRLAKADGAFVIASRSVRTDLLMAAAGLVFIAAVMIMSVASTVRGATGGDPMTMVKATVNQALDVLEDRDMSKEERRQRLFEMVAGRFDFTDMARSALGYHWRQLSPDQREQFVPLFTSFMEDAYLSKLDGYSGQTIEFKGEPADGPNYSKVSSLVIQPNGDQPIRLDYQLKNEDGQWKVYDVTVDDISITANYRNQFDRVINDHGFDALMNEMRAKQQELTASLGQ